MTHPEILREFRTAWLPNVSDNGLGRLIELLESGSPRLIRGAFTKACAMGCLASHIAWNHPATEHLSDDAGVRWLTKVAGLNPATSTVILAWDGGRNSDWELRADLAGACRAERTEREERAELELEDRPALVNRLAHVFQ